MVSSANASLHATIYFSRLVRHAIRPSGSEGAMTWRPFSSTAKTLSLSSLQSSSSSTPPSPFIVRNYHYSSSSYTFPSYVDVRVWWDFDTCELPTGVSVSQVAPIITGALKVNGINGPIQMTAWGNIKNLSIENQEAISTSGIDFKHIEGPDSSPLERQHRVYRAIINDPFWDDDVDYPEYCPPWHLFFISGYESLAFHIPPLIEFKYHVLVASTGPDKDLYFRFANISFDWNSLIRGENLIGHRHEFSLKDYEALIDTEIQNLKFYPEDEDGFSSSEERTSLTTEEEKKRSRRQNEIIIY